MKRKPARKRKRSTKTAEPHPVVQAIARGPQSEQHHDETRQNNNDTTIEAQKQILELLNRPDFQKALKTVPSTSADPIPESTPAIPSMPATVPTTMTRPLPEV